jgi:signal transduction histidine kinase
MAKGWKVPLSPRAHRALGMMWLGIYPLLLVALWALIRHSETMKLGGLFLAVGNLMCCGLFYLRSRSEALPRPWRLFAIAQLMYLIAAALLNRIGGNALQISGLPLLYLLLSSAALLLSCTAVLEWPGPSPSHEDRLIRIVDSALTACSVFLLLWMTGLGEHVRLHGGLTWSLSFSARNALIIGTLVYIGSAHRELIWGPLGWLLLGSLNAAFALLCWGHAGAAWAQAPPPLATTAAAITPLLTACAALAPNAPPSTATDRQGLSLPARMLPFLSYLLALGALVYSSRGLSMEPVTFWIFIVCSGLLLTRQLLSLRDMRQWASQLESKVAERTKALEESQSLVLRIERMNTVSSLGAGLAHDLKNLLGIVKNYAELMRMDMEQGLPPQMEDIENIIQASRQSSDLANELMTMGRGDDAPPEPLDLGPRIRQLALLLRAAIPMHIQFDVHIVDTPLMVRASPKHIDQTLVNLVLNARDALPNKGWIRIDVSAIASGVRIQVQDNGQGMPPEVKDRLFEPFFTTKEPGKGTGLGLASVRSVMTELQGHIHVESVQGQGTTFTIDLPAAKTA